MKANELLLWLSARRQGSWRQFRAAAEELNATDETSDEDAVCVAGDEDFPLYQQLRLDFERLGHVEFFARGCEEGWRVTPPTLAAHLLPSGARAVLCGARSPSLIERVLQTGGEMSCEIVNSPSIPAVVFVTGRDLSAIAEAATEVGVRFQDDAPLAILSHLPPCDPPSSSIRPSEFPQGVDWAISKFSVKKLTWRRIKRSQADVARFGVFRFLIHFQRPRYFLRWKGNTFEMPRAVAIYALLHHRRRGLLRYDIKTATLSLPAVCRPPRLLERALVLCSGFPPSYDASTARLSYSEAPLEVAHLAAELLRQPLK